MLDFLWKKKRLNNAAHKLFCEVIEQSRLAIFYQKFAVEDSLDGRFDVMAIHMSIILDKFDYHNDMEDTKVTKRNLQEIMFDNLDLSLREIGVGDLGVGKKIKVMAEAFYGRMKVYQVLFESKNVGKMTKAIQRNLYRGKNIDENVLLRMSEYIYNQSNHVADQSIEEILKGKLNFLLPTSEI